MRTRAFVAALGALGALGAAHPAAGEPARAVADVPSICTAAPTARRAPMDRAPTARPPSPGGAPAYYAVDLVTTRNIPATGRARGTAEVTFAPSPYGVALASDGSFLYDVSVRLSEMKAPARGTLVAWITTPEVDSIQRLGALDEHLSVEGRVSWNKFLVVVTLEEADDASAATWSGPIVLRGMSRSGMMHTMAGHGPFQQERCAKYGYR